MGPARSGVPHWREAPPILAVFTAPTSGVLSDQDETGMPPNNRRLLEPIGNTPPAEAEARDYGQTEDVARAA